MTYTIKVQSFEGPLEILLTLIEEHKLSINTIALAEVTQGFFSYLERLEKEAERLQVTYERLSRFLVVASTLILIKSKSLLPGFQLTQEEEESITDLTNRLKIYKYIKDIAVSLEQKERQRAPLFSKKPFAGVRVEFLPPKTFPLQELPQILKDILQTIQTKEPLPKKQLQKVISIEKKISELERRIKEGVIKSFSDFVQHTQERTEIIVSFLALLELMKLGIVAAEQAERFSEITFISPNPHHEH